MFDFITADPHFDHPNIIRHCERPFDDVEEMNAYMQERWNGIVGKRDKIAVIGDFAFQRHARWLNELNGRITLIVGNHDKMPLKVSDNFTQMIGKDRYPGVLEYRVDNQFVVLCHYPMYTWRWANYGAWMLHGHSHGRVQHPDHILTLDMGIDLWGFTPVPWEVVVERMAPKVQAQNAHKATMERPKVSYWQDVVRDQYRENRAAWARVTKGTAPLDPRDPTKTK